ncbi:hypothetical protein DESC_780470 [Desulfosarcina cetonica]|nr:hypothetical protein DESC_780470 [Desulfosarcina cetonica]
MRYHKICRMDADTAAVEFPNNASGWRWFHEDDPTRIQQDAWSIDGGAGLRFSGQGACRREKRAEHSLLGGLQHGRRPGAFSQGPSRSDRACRERYLGSGHDQQTTRRRGQGLGSDQREPALGP